jgi:hypothetical protein
MYYLGAVSGNISQGYWDRDYKYSIAFGGSIPGGLVGSPLLTAAEAYALDLKYDDGSPASGQIYAPANIPGVMICSTTNDPTTAAYNVTASGKICAISFSSTF